MNIIRWLPLLALTFFVVTGCGGSSPEKKAEKMYDIEGTVVSVDKDKSKVTLDHKDIPGFMKAMTMPFNVADPNLLTDLKAGDEVRGRLKVKTGEYVITELKKQ